MGQIILWSNEIHRESRQEFTVKSSQLHSLDFIHNVDDSIKKNYQTKAQISKN